MPTPKDLPGFYFDPEKNRYFPIKGPIPGSKRPPPSSSPSGEPWDASKRHHISKARRRDGMKPLELLQFRELLGTVGMPRCKYNFKREYEKSQASDPMVWKYLNTSHAPDSALEQLHGVIQTLGGLKETDLLLGGSTNGTIWHYGTGDMSHYLEASSEYTAELILPNGSSSGARKKTALRSIWGPTRLPARFSSDISCIQRTDRHCSDLADDASSCNRALVTTLGSGVSGGSVYVLNLSEPLEFTHTASVLRGRTSKVASFDCTIWTADCSYDGIHAVIGTNLGAASINLETRASAWVYRCKSDIFSQQFDHSGNIVLCGLRNGAIVIVDVREKQSRASNATAAPPRVSGVQRANHDSSVRHANGSKQRFKTNKSSISSSNPFMPSSVCSLVKLHSDDQYFLASSMDGSIKLFDLRLLHRGEIQSYEGLVNSHSRLQLGVNPSETLLLSGGEDRCVRIWSLKTSELLFEDNVANSIFSTVSWQQGGIQGALGPQRFCENGYPFELNQSWGVWLGSVEGLFYMHGT